ncbi:hypothetical protein BKA67DRAFT_311877 [Truncatella angustata]|uniref:Letm1 RBD domain-containing protein n=1 Tax=Truncatella angustata TaxID=152316 RepID=A0A9P8ZWS4_9PEZI|nr:uncharacterized protein BKA67DRAFT_311877 [Truncatella angustata]KAH6653222.1 hypothetical protein BKA67DRAFT_311877 [Truncatella angustata]KAH8198939.1 hypothetical protein TruAng_006900 [Truncatella angustata]
MNVQLGRQFLRVQLPRAQSVTPVSCSRRIAIPQSSRQSNGRPHAVSPVSRRYASGQAAAAEAKQEDEPKINTEAVTTPLDATTQVSTPLNPDVALSSTLNPPATTRPPLITIPKREPDSSLFSYLFSVGKTYLTFYKNGVKAINTNRKLLKEISQTLDGPPNLTGSDTKVTPTRAAVLLRERTRHDIARLPIFGLVFLICGEFTPLLVLVFPKLTPLTCRIPKQVEKLRANAQERRAASLENMRHITESAALEKASAGNIVRCLGLGSSIWDKVGIDPPFAAAKAQAAVSRILKDDIMIRDGGGVGALDPEEVVLACEDRGFDVRDGDVDKLRAKLQQWIQSSTKAEGADGEARIRKMIVGLDPDEK